MKQRDPRFLRTGGAVARSSGRRRRSFRVIVAVAIILFFTGVGLTLLAYSFFTGPSQFVVRKLVINGAVFADDAAIRASVVEKTKGNMLLVDLQEICRAVETVPWVKEAAAKKVLPETLELEIVERTPCAYAVLNDEIWLVDDGGVLIDRLRPEHPFLGLPLLRGFDGLTPEERDARLSLGVSLLQQIKGERPEWYERISDLDLSHPESLSATIEGARAPVIIGDADPVGRLGKYFMIEGTLQQRYDAVEYYDTRFARRLYVKASGKQE